MRFDTGGPNGRGTVDLSVSPARVGYNDIDINVLDPNGRPEQIAELDAALLLAAPQIGPLPVRVIVLPSLSDLSVMVVVKSSPLGAITIEPA